MYYKAFKLAVIDVKVAQTIASFLDHFNLKQNSFSYYSYNR